MDFQEVITRIDEEIDQLEILGLVPGYVVCNDKLYNEVMDALSAGTRFKSTYQKPSSYPRIQKGPYALSVISSSEHEGINMFARLPDGYNARDLLLVPMVKCGNSTRLLDYYIQKLFKNGEVIISDHIPSRHADEYLLVRFIGRLGEHFSKEQMASQVEVDYKKCYVRIKR